VGADRRRTARTATALTNQLRVTSISSFANPTRARPFPRNRLALCAAAPAFALDAVVTHCHDGDTCTLADGERVRLHAIDAPELAQPYGEQTRAPINQLIAGQRVDVRPTGDTSYQRMVADIVRADGLDVAAIMVSRGYAWVEDRWNTDPAMPARQRAAQAARSGLWAADLPSGRIEYRRGSRSCSCGT
jgi:micrococcal nuclease